MSTSSIKHTPTRFASLAIRSYRNCTCQSPKGGWRKETWFRFVDTTDDMDIGAIYRTMPEITADIERFAEERGLTEYF